MYVTTHCLQQHSETFELIITLCPPGHTLQSTGVNDEFECQCDDNNDDNIVNCLLEERRLILEVIKHTYIQTQLHTMY